MIGQESIMSPSVSVLMSVWNPHPVYFPLAVRSILAQTKSNIELIIVEDPSPRDGHKMLAGINDSRINHVANPTRVGLIGQRNQCLALARADLVAIHDADDLAEPSRIQKQADYLAEHSNIDVLGSQICVIDEHGMLRGFRRFPKSPDAILSAMPYFVPLSHPSVMFRKQVVIEAGGYQNSVHPHVDDYELWSRLAKRGVKIANLSDVLIRYRIHPEMGKINKLREVIRGVLRIKRLYWAEGMSLKAQIRMWGEYCLLWLPDAVVMRLMLCMLYRERDADGKMGTGLAWPSEKS